LVLQRLVKSPRISKDVISTWFQQVREGMVRSCSVILNGIDNELKEAMNIGYDNSKTQIQNVFMGYICL